MKGAIFFATKYGSTAEYARWIGEAVGLPVFDTKSSKGDPADYDFLILATPVIYYRLIIAKWVRRHMSSIGDKPVILVTVSGARAGKKLDGWISNSLPPELVAKAKHFALGGRQHPTDLTWFDWMMLKIAGLTNPDRKAAKDEAKGFDHVDKASIEPVVVLARDLQGADDPQFSI